MAGKSKENSRPTQVERLLDYLEENGSITSLEAYNELGITQLGARIFELKKLGYQFEGSNITVKNRFQEKCSVKKYKLKVAE